MTKTKKLPSNNTTKNKARILVHPWTAIGALVIFAILFGAWYMTNTRSGSGNENVQFVHIHGIGFSSDGRQLFVTAHDGFRVYEAGHWKVPDLPINDYMGYNPTDNGFYSSGHPGPGSNLANPLGLIRSSDGGRTFTTLSFAGESDFHLMGVGYNNHAIYALNPSPNSRLSVGLYYSLNDGQHWQQSAGQGIAATPIQVAVHPTQAEIVAIATENGLFLSNDYGNTFNRVNAAAPVSAVIFDSETGHLLFGYQSLYTYDLGSNQTAAFPSPSISSNDAISYIAGNAQSNQVALSTFNKNIYLSQDSGQAWNQIAQEGSGRS